MLPIISSGEHLTIATQGIEKRNIALVEGIETSNAWAELRITEWDGSSIRWDVEARLVERMVGSVKDVLKVQFEEEDKILNVLGQQVEKRLIHAYDCSLYRPEYPSINIYLHGGKKLSFNQDYDLIKREFVSLIVNLHNCTKKEALQCAEYYE